MSAFSTSKNIFFSFYIADLSDSESIERAIIRICWNSFEDRNNVGLENTWLRVYSPFFPPQTRCGRLHPEGAAPKPEGDAGRRKESCDGGTEKK